MANYNPLRTGEPLDAELAERLRAAIRERGSHRVITEMGGSPAALANAAAGSHVAPGTAARVRAYLAALGVPRVPCGGELGPGVVT